MKQAYEIEAWPDGVGGTEEPIMVPMSAEGLLELRHPDGDADVMIEWGKETVNVEIYHRTLDDPVGSLVMTYAEITAEADEAWGENEDERL